MATSYRPRLHTPYRNSFLPYSTPCSVVLLLCLLVPTVTSLAPKPKRDLCDLSNGAWIRSPKRFPRYTTVAGRPKSCPFARSSYACERNNRPDLRYREYRWQPFDCPISYFSVSGFRFLMRDRRMLLVGDSMMSNLFEALLCSISSAGYEGQPFRRKTKGDFSIKGVHFPAFSFSLEYYFSPYIVRTSRRSIHNKATGKDAIKGGHGFDVYVDEMDPVLERVLASYSAVVFHSGVWWLQNVPRRTVPNNFYANGAQRNLSNIAAHTWALSTVLSFVKKIDYSGVPFFLSFSPKHAGAGQTQPGVEQSDGAAWVGACGARMPASRTFVHSRYSDSLSTAEEYAAAQKSLFLGSPFRFLDVTSISALRPDAHLGVWWQRRDQSGPNSPQGQRESPFSGDCTHWCLPGIPDMWVDVMYTHMILEPSLFPKKKRKRSHS